MPINKFLPYATGAGANVTSDDAWPTADTVAQGVQYGPADPAQANKAWRQGSVIASVIGQFITDFAQVDTNDSQSIATLEANLRIALAASLDGARMGVDTSVVANTITFPLVPLPPTLTGLKVIWFKPAVTNTGPATAQILKADGTAAFSALPIKKRSGTDPAAGDLQAGIWYGAICDGTAFRLIAATASDSASITPGLTTNKVPFGTTVLTTTLQTSMSVPAGTAAGTLVVAMSGLTYNKKSPTSTILVWSDYVTFAPVNVGAGNGADTVRMTVGTQFDENPTSNGYMISGTPVAPGSSPLFIISGLNATGPQAVSLAFKRANDTLAWSTIFNPGGSTVGGGVTTPQPKFFFVEVEL